VEDNYVIDSAWWKLGYDIRVDPRLGPENARKLGDSPTLTPRRIVNPDLDQEVHPLGQLSGSNYMSLIC
jgi:hypothetical protein